MADNSRHPPESLLAFGLVFHQQDVLNDPEVVRVLTAEGLADRLDPPSHSYILEATVIC